jgi:4-hydroxy-3-methylbut-2-enyl diphosphate reductase IspH
MMRLLKVKELQEKIESIPNMIVILGDPISSNTRNVYSLFEERITIIWDLYVIDTEEELESYQKFRLRNTPTIHIYQDGTLTKVLSNKELPKTITEVDSCILLKNS